MPELSVAPSPAPMAPMAAAVAEPKASPSPASSTASTANAAANNADNPTTEAPATPFATVLQRQMAQPGEAKAAVKAIAALLGNQSNDSQPSADTQADALAFLAPFLAGIAPAQPATAAATAAQDSGGLQGDNTQGADLGRLLTDTGLPAAPAAPPTLPIAAPVQPVTQTVEVTPQAAEKPVQASAIIAAATPLAADSLADKTHSGNHAQGGFETLLEAAREAPLTAAHNAAAANAAPAATAPAVTNVATPVGTQGWDNEIGNKIVWMNNRQESRAELVLNPPQFGRIEVSLSMNGDQATANFVSANPAVREALENAVPRLREILQDAGISLGQTQVGAESFQQSAGSRENSDNSSRNKGRDTDVMTPGLIAGQSAPTQWSQRGNGLVDTFA